jgi:hypothetical protein
MATGDNVKRQLNRRERDQQKYQGWTNWATWNVALWLGNTHDVYRDYRDRLAHQGPFTAKTAEAFVRNVWPLGTPDMRSSHHRKWGKMANVDWQSIAEDMNQE